MARAISDIRARAGRNPGAAAGRPSASSFGSRGRLDLATLLGLGGGFALIAAAIVLGGNWSAFIDMPSVLIVIGGTLAVTTICFSLSEVLQAQRLLFKTLIAPTRDPSEASIDLLRLAESARKNGVLSLERELARLGGAPFLAKGLTLVVDGGSADDVERMMRRELYAIEGRHGRGAGVLRKSAELAPAMGLIGTLIGLVQMLGHLDDPAKIGPGMAVALLTTFYGAVMSTLVFTPLAAKLERNSAEESVLNQIYLLAITSIARQENPRRLELQINAMLPPARRIRYFN